MYIFNRNYVSKSGKGYAFGQEVPNEFTQEVLDGMVKDGLIKEVEGSQSFADKVNGGPEARRVSTLEEAAAEAPTNDPIPPSSYSVTAKRTAKRNPEIENLDPENTQRSK